MATQKVKTKHLNYTGTPITGQVLKYVDLDTMEFGNDATVVVDDSPYGSSWDGDTTNVPSKNALYDEISTLENSISSLSGSVGSVIAGNDYQVVKSVEKTVYNKAIFNPVEVNFPSYPGFIFNKTGQYRVYTFAKIEYLSGNATNIDIYTGTINIKKNGSNIISYGVQITDSSNTIPRTSSVTESRTIDTTFNTGDTITRGVSTSGSTKDIVSYNYGMGSDEGYFKVSLYIYVKWSMGTTAPVV